MQSYGRRRRCGRGVSGSLDVVPFASACNELYAVFDLTTFHPCCSSAASAMSVFSQGIKT